MSIVGRVLNSALRTMGYELSRVRPKDPTSPFNVPAEWTDAGPKPEKPERIVVGGGDCAYGPRWHNIEYVTEGYAEKYKALPANTDIAHDLTSGLSLQIEDSSIEAAYTSHVIEHLKDEHVDFIFSEIHRVLQTGGVFRITCPDIDLYVRAFMDKDLSFFHYRNHPHYRRLGISESVCGLFLDVFATELGERKEKIEYAEVHDAFAQKGVVSTLEFYANRVRYSKAKSHYHVNWFNTEKIQNMLRKAGFSNIRISGIGQSYYPDMRNLTKFDTQDFKISLFVECIK